MEIEQIKSVLKERGLTYLDLSKMSKVPESTLKNIFAGYTKYPRIDTMRAIEEALGIGKEQAEEKKEPPELSDGEKALLELFNRVPADKQGLVVQMIEAALKSIG